MKITQQKIAFVILLVFFGLIQYCSYDAARTAESSRLLKFMELDLYQLVERRNAGDSDEALAKIASTELGRQVSTEDIDTLFSLIGDILQAALVKVDACKSVVVALMQRGKDHGDIQEYLRDNHDADIHFGIIRGYMKRLAEDEPKLLQLPARNLDEVKCRS